MDEFVRKWMEAHGEHVFTDKEGRPWCIDCDVGCPWPSARQRRIESDDPRHRRSRKPWRRRLRRG